MSEIVHYRGKLKEIPMKINETLEKQCKRICNENGLNKIEPHYENWEEALYDEFYEKYCMVNEKLYEVKTKNSIPEGDLFLANRGEDNEIEYEVQYYNGGCGFSEAIEEAINNIK